MLFVNFCSILIFIFNKMNFIEKYTVIKSIVLK